MLCARVFARAFSGRALLSARSLHKHRIIKAKYRRWLRFKLDQCPGPSG
jgi:phage anti-repressor protein